MTDSDDVASDARARAVEELRAQYPPLLTSAHVAQMMHCTIGEVRDQVHRGVLPAVRWGQQFRFFREEVLAVLLGEPVVPGEEPDTP